MKEVLELTGKNDFSRIYDLMRLSFPPEEFRSFEAERALFDRPDYKVWASRSNGGIFAFIAEWILKDAHFLEHFCVDPQARGHGMGTQILRTYLQLIKAPVVLEVEADSAPISRRRIAFYERLGFVLSSVEYKQPPLRTAASGVSLRLMHYPAKIPIEVLRKIKQEIFQTVYRVA